MSDLDEILGGKPVEEPKEQPKVEAPKEELPVEAEPPEEPETPEVEEKEPNIPYAVFKSTRDDLKSQITRLEREMQRASQPKAEPEPVPDLLEDQQGFTNYLRNEVQRATQNVRFDVSEQMARDAHGDEVVDAALEAAESANATGQFHKSRHPWGDMVKWHKQQVAAAEIGDPEKFRERLKAEVLKEIQAEMAAKQVSEMAAKKAPSMANVTGSGGKADPGWAGPADLGSIIGE